MVTKPVKPDFDTLAASIADLRDARAKLNTDRNAIGGRIREILDTPPAKSDLKDAMRRVIERYAEAWNKPLTEQLQPLKSGATLDDFVSRHASLGRNTDAIGDNGWFALIAPAMLAGVDQFVDQLDWPEGLPAEERAQRLAKLQTELAQVQSKIEAIDRQFSEIGANPVRPAEAII
ncbi:MAG: hypothetical protein KDJ54_12985 [Candidatus Competibacteraceae bacterium]|nr:hypothetical protein [Candidatus Competibacteraceae bacterium]